MTTTSTPAQKSAPTTLPETGFIRLSTILLFIPLSSSTIWRKVKKGEFPKPYKLSENITAWKAEDIKEWIGNLKH